MSNTSRDFLKIRQFGPAKGVRAPAPKQPSRRSRCRRHRLRARGYEPYLIQLGLLSRTSRGQLASKYFGVQRTLRYDDQPASFCAPAPQADRAKQPRLVMI